MYLRLGRVPSSGRMRTVSLARMRRLMYEYGSFTLPKTSASYLQLSTQAGLRPSANLVWRQKSQLSATFVYALMKRAL